MIFQKKMKIAISNAIKKGKYIIQNNKEAVNFLLKFCIIATFLFTIYYVLIDSFQGLLLGTAWLSGSIANMFGLSVAIEGVIIDIGTMNLEIIPECTGIFAIFVTLACILSYPSDYKKKGLGVVMIIPMILFLNLLRLLVLIFVGKNYSDIFEYVHSYLWQATFIIFIIFAWFLWIEMVVKK